MSRLKRIIGVVFIILISTVCVNAKFYVTIPYGKDPKRITGTPPEYNYGLRIQVSCDIKEDEIQDLSKLTRKQAKMVSDLKFERAVKQHITQYIEGIAYAAGMEPMPSSNYILKVTVTDWRLIINEYSVKKMNIIASSYGEMTLNWELLNPEQKVVISNTTYTGNATGSDSQYLTPLFESFQNAVHGIEWDRIASYLMAEKLEKNNSQVNGSGSTALEHTVIRWYIQSAPQGADVSWRVISSSPEVSNTNSNFVGTTPYESTESFDIKGLTYDNSGNVQIEVTCEKSGYLPQRKRFNLRQAIDQKEISAKFNLIKDE